jgi:hypothetical protein
MLGRSLPGFHLQLTFPWDRSGGRPGPGLCEILMIRTGRCGNFSRRRTRRTGKAQWPAPRGPSMITIKEEAKASPIGRRREKQRSYWLEIIAINITLWCLIALAFRLAF